MFAKTNYLAGPKTICTEMLNSVKLQKKNKHVYFLNAVKPNFGDLGNLSKTTGLWSEKKIILRNKQGYTSFPSSKTALMTSHLKFWTDSSEAKFFLPVCLIFARKIPV